MENLIRQVYYYPN